MNAPSADVGLSCFCLAYDKRTNQKTKATVAPLSCDEGTTAFFYLVDDG